MKYAIGTKVVVLTLVLSLVALPAPAATQMDAGDDPEVSGSLELQSDDCRRQEEKDDAGEVIARGKTCLRVYGYDPASETDSDRNYGVVWLQSNVNSMNGWCTARVFSDVDLPNVVRVESKAPKSMTLGRRKIFETVLTTNAAGNGAEEASVRQSQILYPEAVRVRVLEDSNLFRLRWVGLRNVKLGFASGVEVSWPVDEDPRIAFRLNYELKPGSC